MRRRLFNILAAVSLVLCLATIAVWVRSYFANDYYPIRLFRQVGPQWTQDNRTWIRTHAGRLIFTQWNERYPGPQRPQYMTVPNPTSKTHFGLVTIVRYVSVKRVGGQPETTAWTAVSPRCVTTVPTAVLPAVWFAMWHRRRSRERLVGHCLACGYNLTGNVSGICPECGTAIPARVKAT